MRVLDKALEILSDGEWHSLVELSRRLELNKTKQLLLFNFLINYNFCDAKRNSLKAREDFVTFFKRLEGNGE